MCECKVAWWHCYKYVQILHYQFTKRTNQLTHHIFYKQIIDLWSICNHNELFRNSKLLRTCVIFYLLETFEHVGSRESRPTCQCTLDYRYYIAVVILLVAFFFSIKLFRCFGILSTLHPNNHEARMYTHKWWSMIVFCLFLV